MFCSPPFSFFSYVFCASWTYRTGYHGLVWSGLVLVVWSGSSFFPVFVVGFVLMKRKKEMEQSEKFGMAGWQAGRHGMEAGKARQEG